MNQNITLNSPFITPISNQIGYQVFGTIISDNTTLISGNTYVVSVINLSAGVWSIFGQVSYKCSSIDGTIPLITYNGFSLNNSTTNFGTYRIENYSFPSVDVNNIYCEQIVIYKYTFIT